jgi:molybdenum cofactor cytidylyltransferase
MSPSPKISAILLAAGTSVRLGRNKLLLPLSGGSVVQRVALALIDSRAAEVIVVTGHQAAEVRTALGGLSVRFTHNPDFETGQASSLKAGLKAAAEGADGYLFALGDQPLIQTDLVDRLIASFAPGEGEPLAAAPFFKGRRGNPVVISSRLRERLESLSGDEGAKGILKSIMDESPARLAAVEAESEDNFRDIDTQDDFDRLKNSFTDT